MHLAHRLPTSSWGAGRGFPQPDQLSAPLAWDSCGVMWCGVVWCGVVWCGVVWCGVVWCGVVWCGVVWCGVVWCGVVCRRRCYQKAMAGMSTHGYR